MKDVYQNLLSKQEIQFWVPFVTILVSLGITFGILSTQLSTIIKNQEQQYSMWLQLEKRVGANEIETAKNEVLSVATQLRVTALEAANNLRK